MPRLDSYEQYLMHLAASREQGPKVDLDTTPKTYATALAALKATECYARGIDDKTLYIASKKETADSKYNGANAITLHCDELCDPGYIRPILRSGALNKWKHNQGAPKPSAKFSKKHSGALISDTSGIYRTYDVFFLHDDRLTKHKLTQDGKDKYTWMRGFGSDRAAWFSPYVKNMSIAGDSTKEDIQSNVRANRGKTNELLRGLSLDSLLGMGCVDDGLKDRLKLLEVYTREMTVGNYKRRAMRLTQLPKMPLVLHYKGYVKEYTPSLIKKDLQTAIENDSGLNSLEFNSLCNIIKNMRVNRVGKSNSAVVNKLMQEYTKSCAVESAPRKNKRAMRHAGNKLPANSAA